MILSDIENRQRVIVQQITQQLAIENEIPMMAVGWQVVREEIELTVNWLLTSRAALQAAITPKLAHLVAAWRSLDREASAERARGLVLGATAMI